MTRLVNLVQDTLQASHISSTPLRLMGDKAYDSDPLNAELKEMGIDMITLTRSMTGHPIP